MAASKANPALDRDALHRYLWERANPAGKIVIHQGELAEKLDVTRGTVVRVCREMVEAGRMKKVDSLERNVKMYQITNPKTWAEGNAAQKAPRRIAWS